MSANLLDGLRPIVREGAASSDGTLHFPARASGAAQQDWLSYDLQGQSALKENQTYHVGLSVRGASAYSGHLRPFVGYMDAAGNKNWVLTPFLSVGTSWGRANGTLVVPSGMTPFSFGVQVIGSCPETWMAAPTLSLGSPVPLAISTTTIAWSAGIVAATRYYKLASATSSTPSVPASSSALNGWSETEPTADVTKVLWVCERTVYADGSESWSKASKSTSYEAAKDAKGTANAAKGAADRANSKADNLSTLIHEGDDGITVGKSSDGKTYATGRTRMTDRAFQVLGKAGDIITQLANDGASFLSGLVKISVGTGQLPGNKTTVGITINAGDGVSSLRGIISRLDAAIEGITSSVSAGWEQDFGFGVTAITRRSNTVVSAAYLAPDKAELHVGDNHVTMTGDGFELSRPYAMRSAIGLGFTQLYYDYDAGWVVYASDYLVWIYAWGVAIGSGSWDSKTCPYVLPEKYRPRLSHITTPISVTNGGSVTAVLSVNSQGQISVKNNGSAGSTDARYGILFYPVGV